WPPARPIHAEGFPLFGRTDSQHTVKNIEISAGGFALQPPDLLQVGPTGEPRQDSSLFPRHVVEGRCVLATFRLAGGAQYSLSDVLDLRGDNVPRNASRPLGVDGGEMLGAPQEHIAGHRPLDARHKLAVPIEVHKGPTV